MINQSLITFLSTRLSIMIEQLIFFHICGSNCKAKNLLAWTCNSINSSTLYAINIIHCPVIPCIKRILCLLLSLQTCHQLWSFFKASVYNVFAVMSTTMNDAFVVLDLSFW